MIKYDQEAGTLQIQGSEKILITDLAALVLRVCFNVTDNEKDCNALANKTADFIKFVTKDPNSYRILAGEAEGATVISLGPLKNKRE